MLADLSLLIQPGFSVCVCVSLKWSAPLIDQQAISSSRSDCFFCLAAGSAAVNSGINSPHVLCILHSLAFIRATAQHGEKHPHNNNNLSL